MHFNNLHAMELMAPTDSGTMHAGLVAASMPTPTARITRFHMAGVTMFVMLPWAWRTTDSREMAASATSLRPPAMLDSATTMSSSQPPAAAGHANPGYRVNRHTDGTENDSVLHTCHALVHANHGWQVGTQQTRHATESHDHSFVPLLPLRIARVVHNHAHLLAA